ncbi:deoxyribose-phosphate aldolase [Brachybacterium vulturis]|uniref:Cgl0159 family (beta/alpha)8-fold protein n=1 Tax=Brachybacterium vulturis TaxID=2017484 RepID=UPI0037360A11
MSAAASQTAAPDAVNTAPSTTPAAEFVSTYEDVTRVRIEDPGRFARLAATRRRRTVADTDGRMMIIAADHPARGALGVGPRGQAMASRTELLDRLREALAVPGVDGVLGTADILEDLLVMGALEDKIVFASMNRGGLQGGSWEIEDRFTAYDAASIRAAGFDGGKMLTRIDLEDDRTSFILEASAHAVTDLARHELIAMVEPFLSGRPGGPGTKVMNDLSPEAVIKSIHIAQGLGATSAFTWLKLPAVDDMERVMDATTLPTLILGGDPTDDDPVALRATWKRALDRPNVRGLVVGRTLLYPAGDDVTAAVRASVDMLR